MQQREQHIYYICAYITEEEGHPLVSGRNQDYNIEVENYSSQSNDVVEVGAGHSYQSVEE